MLQDVAELARLRKQVIGRENEMWRDRKAGLLECFGGPDIARFGEIVAALRSIKGAFAIDPRTERKGRSRFVSGERIAHELAHVSELVVSQLDFDDLAGSIKPLDRSAEAGDVQHAWRRPKHYWAE